MELLFKNHPYHVNPTPIQKAGSLSWVDGKEDRNPAGIVSEIGNKISAEETRVIVEAVNSYFGNDNFEDNIKQCRGGTEQKTNIKRLFHGDILICEIHPCKISFDNLGVLSASVDYKHL